MHILKILAPQNWDLDGPYGLTLFLVSLDAIQLLRGQEEVSRKSTVDHMNKKGRM